MEAGRTRQFLKEKKGVKKVKIKINHVDVVEQVPMSFRKIVKGKYERAVIIGKKITGQSKGWV
jgi:hypothetical protein